MKRFLVYFILAGLAAPSARAVGMEEKSGESTEKNGAQKDTSDYEVVVTATRTQADVRKLGQSVTVISREEIEAQGARTVEQVLETVPGFNVVRNGSFGGATTVRVRGGENDFNLVLIDGVQINRPGGQYDFANLPTANIERIEIVRGPSSALYGADSASSTIHIITRTGSGTASGYFGFEGGNYGTVRLRGGLQGSKDRFNYSFGGSFSDSDGILEFNNQYDNTTLTGQVGFDVTSKARWTAALHFSDSEFNFPTDFSGAVVDPNDFQQTEEIVFSTAYQQQVTDIYSTKLQYGYFRGDFRSFTVFDGVTDFFDDTFESVENRNQFDWQNDFRLGEQHLLTAGLAFEREESDTASQDRRSVGVYFQEQFSFRDRFFVTAGVRYEENNRFQDFTTGFISGSFLVNPTLKVRGSFGNGLRAPSFIETLGIPAFGIQGNPRLRPEENLAGDFGFDYYAPNGKGRFSATAFFNRFRDLIEFTFAVPFGDPNYLNLEEARSQGLELEGFLSLVNEFGVGGHYTYTDTEVTDAGTTPGGSFVEGEDLLRRPRHTAGIYAQFLQNRRRFRIDLKYKGTREDLQFFPDFSSSRIELPPYWRVDFGVTLPFLKLSDSGDVAVVFRGQNIFNNDYTEIAGFQSPGRSAQAGIEVNFK